HRTAGVTRDGRSRRRLPGKGSAAPAAECGGGPGDADALPAGRSVGQRARARLVGTSSRRAHRSPRRPRLAPSPRPQTPGPAVRGFPPFVALQAGRNLMSQKNRLERVLSLAADVRAGEGPTVLLMLVNIFLLLICYAVIKTVREPLILLGGGAEVRSYTAAGPALVLFGFVPLDSRVPSRVARIKPRVGVSLFFVLKIALFGSPV